MKKKIVTGLLLAISAAAVSPAFAAHADVRSVRSEKYEKIKNKSQNNYTDARKAFEHELAKTSYSDEITIVVFLKDQNKNSDIKNDDVKESIIKRTEAAQDAVLEKIKKEGISFSPDARYSFVLNGFSGKTSVENAKKIAMLSEVKDLTISAVFNEPPSNAKDTMIQDQKRSLKLPGQDRDETLYGQYKGEKKIVAIIDSGIDHTHPDFRLTNPSAAVYPDEASVKSQMDKLGIKKGGFLSSKVPFTYNYAEFDMKLKDTKNNMHGQHVAGIVAANGEKLKGMAPESQILALKVFANSTGQTTSDAYIRALEDAVKLNANSINMSLGSPAGTIG